MKQIRTAKITIHTEETILIRRADKPIEAHCAECREVVDMATPELAATMYGVSTRLIYRWLEARRLHFVEISNGLVMICLVSLRQGLSPYRRELPQPISDSQEE